MTEGPVYRKWLNLWDGVHSTKYAQMHAFVAHKNVNTIAAMSLPEYIQPNQRPLLDLCQRQEHSRRSHSSFYPAFSFFSTILTLHCSSPHYHTFSLTIMILLFNLLGLLDIATCPEYIRGHMTLSLWEKRKER